MLYSSTQIATTDKVIEIGVKKQQVTSAHMKNNC